MKQYNIYYSTFGDDMSYKYTTLANSVEEAEKEASETMCALANQHLHSTQDHVFDGLLNTVPEFCDVNIIISDSYQKVGECKAILTEEDNIDEDDIILNYVTRGCFNSTDSE